MPELTLDEVERIAMLARLALSDDEKALYAAQLARILDFARQVAELEEEATEPVPGGLDAAPVERSDAPRPSLERGQALANAPDSSSGLFRVPKVLGDA